MSATQNGTPQQPPQRTVAQVQQEFANLAVRAGSLQFEIEGKKNDLKLVNDSLRNLTFEYNTLLQKEQAIAQAVQAAAQAAKAATPPAPEAPLSATEGAPANG